MLQWIEDLKAKPWVAHIIEAFGRFGERLGGQFAAAITYFSVLSIVPVLMVAFAALGLTITVFLPDVLEQVKGWIQDTVAGQGDLGEQLGAVVDQAFNSWQAVGVVGLVSAVWSGANWVKNIRSAVRAMMRTDFDMSEEKTNIVLDTLKNVAILLGLFVLVALSMAMTTVATSARDIVGGLLGLDRVPGGGLLLSLVPVLGTLLAGFLLFAFLFKVFPERKVPTPVLLRGAAIGAVGMSILQYLTGTLVGVFSGNAAAAVFGSVIVTMLYFNLFATLILLDAAWVGTHPGFVGPTVTLTDVTPATPTDYATKKVAAELAAAREREEAERIPVADADRRAAASRGVGAAAGALVTGAVAAIAAILSGLGRR
ncbi:YhjD/YihY/BrkB family envelope integrity protein [Propioniciclava sinopodophylli]|uniref:YhjD/YihY/BrkB family envelope integrity protein n=1 Tax=Propioniciclava sinopodophylli TaxID=1837344 RepID=UPI0024928FAA|nr:YhjD/YihY/BrkB family envelope integrity protein [Propioniciclava sinopodophylli]